MFVVEYFARQNDMDLKRTSKQYTDSIAEEYNSKREKLDTFIYVADLFRVVTDCTHELLNLPSGHTISFWQANKLFISYLNAIYFYKEYIKNTSFPTDAIVDRYWKKMGMFRFIYDFRNHVIHESLIIKDRSVYSGDVFVEIEEMLTKVAENISSLEAEGKGKKKINAEKQFLQTVNDFHLPIAIQHGNKKLLSVKELAKAAQPELEAANQEVLARTFEVVVMPILEWLLSLIHRENGQYKYTFIINKKWQDIPEKEPDCLFEPALQIESFLAELCRSLGKQDALSTRTYMWLKEKGYAFNLGTQYNLTSFFETET